MALEIAFFLLLGSGILILAGLNVALLFNSYRINEKINNLLENGKIRSFKDIFLRQKEKNEELAKQLKEAFLKIKDLEEISEFTIQKVGIVRFNPFKEIGGNQSFAIALLDKKNNGVIISSFFDTEGCRVFAKPIKNGESEYLLSNEEREAILKALERKCDKKNGNKLNNQ